MEKNKCPICEKINIKQVYSLNKTNLSRYGLEERLSKNTDEVDRKLSINYCENCRFGWNKEFETKKVNYKKEKIIEAGTFSNEYLLYQKKKAKELTSYTKIKKFNVAVEIGAGAGLFIKEVNSKNKVAFEPSQEALKIEKNIKVINDYFKAEKNEIKADIVIMRQVIEHIENPLNFLNQIINTMKEKNKEIILYVEVPNADKTFKLGRFYDIYYEHCNYFSLHSLMKIGVMLNIEVINITKDYNEEILSVVYRKSKNIDIKTLLEKKEKKIRELIFEKYKDKKIIGWGASGNGTAIINKLQINKRIISHLVDSDKNKHGKKIPGMGQLIISSEELKKLKPEVIFIFTQFHKEEIKQQINQLKLNNVIIEVI